MIDIHSHILPNIDDGAKSLDIAIEMARQAEEQGIYLMAATPHHKNGSFTSEKADIVDRVAELNHVLNERGIDVNIVPGQEVRLYGEIVQDYEEGKLQTLNNSSYLLVELPSDQVPAYTSRLIYDLQLVGIQAVIAHPERNRAIIENPDKLYELVKQGALAQLTASSLTGRFGKNIKKFSEQLIEHRLVHMLASDTHNTTTRPNELLAAFHTLEKTFDINTVYYFQENAETLIYGETVLAEPASQIKKKKFLGIF